MGLLFKKRKLELVDSTCICDKASKYTDNADGSVTYKAGFFIEPITYKAIHIVQDKTEGMFDNFTCGGVIKDNKE